MAKLITAHQSSFHYMRLVKTLVKQCTVSFKSEEYKDLSAHVNVLLNAQLAKEKKADGKKPKKGRRRAPAFRFTGVLTSLGAAAVAKPTKNSLKSLEEDMVADEYGCARARRRPLSACARLLTRLGARAATLCERRAAQSLAPCRPAPPVNRATSLECNDATPS